MPVMAEGDLLVVFAYRNGNTNAPGIPAGWTSIASGSGGGGTGHSSTLAYKVAATSSDVSGTWTNATHLTLHVYRDASIGTPVGNNSVLTGTTATNVSVPDLTLQRTNGTSWVVTFFGHRNAASAVGTAGGTALELRATNTISGTIAGADTNMPVNDFTLYPGFTITATSGNYISRAVEIIAQPPKRYFIIT